MAPPSLYDLAKQKVIQNIDMLLDVGDLPFSFLRPILVRIQNPSQLETLEKNCPQLAGETGDLWLRFIKRDIQNWDKKPHQPRDPKSWRKVYRKLVKEAEEEKRVQEEALRAKMQGLKAEREGNQSRIVEAKAGFDPARRRQAHSSGSGWQKTGAPPKKASTTVGKFKRSMWEQNTARPKATQIPQHLLDERKGTVRHAPRHMVEEAQEKRNAIFAPRKGSYASNGSTPAKAISTPTVRPTRESLPVDRTFTAPKLGASTSRPTTTLRAASSPERAVAPPPKRRRVEANVFMPQKRR